MTRFSCALVAILVLCVAGCGGEKDKGINKDKDMPREGPTTLPKK
jgi:hypothetical protein